MEPMSASSFVVAPRCKKRTAVKKIKEPVHETLKIQKKTISQDDVQRTSTPAAPAKFRRLSEVFQKLNLSPVVPAVVDPNAGKGACEEDKMEVSFKRNPLGYPLLSSTKLEPSLDNDRLSNAVRLYRKQLEGKGRLGRGILEELEERKEMKEHVTSQLLRKNAMVDSLEEEKK